MGSTSADYTGKIDVTDLADMEARRPGASQLYTIENAAVLAIDDGYFDSLIRLKIDAEVNQTITITCTGYWASWYYAGDHLGATYWNDQPLAIPVNVNGGSDYTEISLATVNDRLRARNLCKKNVSLFTNIYMTHIMERVLASIVD